MSDIKSMKLYTHVERIDNELAELGKNPGDPISVDELSAFDQLHYHGTEALDFALGMIGSGADQHWLEIGSGIGGPALYLAHQGGIQITALELQPEQNDLAAQLTRRCGIDAQADRTRNVRVHGEATVDALEDFYSAVDHQFQSGKLGGLRLCAIRQE